MSTKYQESLDYLFSQLPMFSRIGAAAYKPGLDTSINLDNYFGNPHKKFKSIHIAGTNGKGSTSHNIASILQQEGYKVGLYTSPHLVDFRERIRINGEMIPEQDVIDFTTHWKESNYEGHPSFFELTMMMAFDWFAKQKVDYAVIEVGMGGRLDSTNIITPIGCVITNISFDHTQFLGDTLPKIAGEKAGIIKQGIPVVIGKADEDVRRVFEAKASEMHSKIVFAQDSPAAIFHMSTPGRLEVCSERYGVINSPLAGEYQKENINTVLHAVDMLREAGVEISDESVAKGIENVIQTTGLQGRWMILQEHPFVVCDTGHNRAGLSFTMHQLLSVFEQRKQEAEQSGDAHTPSLRIVIGFVNDKDVEHIADLLPREALYYVTQASVPRAMQKETLLNILQSKNLKCVGPFDDVRSAAEKALRDSSESDVIYIGGSTFIVADYLASRKG